MWYLLAIIVLLVIWFNRRKRTMSMLKRYCISGPKPHFLFGYLNDPKNLSTIEKQGEWIRKYGKVVGVYSGANPIVLVSDLELIKRIQIKDFNHFTDRPKAFRAIFPIVNFRSNIAFSCGERWKRIRTLITPTFSASKLKKMTEIMDDSINSFIEQIDMKSETGEEFDIYDFTQRLTTDILFRTVFGYRTDVQKDPENQYLKDIDELIEKNNNKWLVLLVNIFPEMSYLINSLRMFAEKVKSKLGHSPFYSLSNMLDNLLKLRKEIPSLRRNDLLQSLLDANISTEDMSAMSDERLIASFDDNNNELKTNGHKKLKPITKANTTRIRLTDEEIITNGLMFYGAGYETSSITLSFVAHHFVNYPEVQERARQEVQELYETEGKLDFNTVSALPYLECVIKETLRLYPPLLFITSRECLTDYKYENMTIPKGATVVIPLFVLHRDADYWPEPEKFDPLRFSPERRHEIQPSSWQPFGNGPRNCVGMRFAWLEMKLCLAKLLLHYRLECGPRTEMGEPKLKCKIFSLGAKNGIFVKVVKI